MPRPPGDCWPPSPPNRPTRSPAARSSAGSSRARRARSACGDPGHRLGAARGRCPERPSKPLAAPRPRREGSTPSPFRSMTTSGPLTLGTAGHIDHGKTALVRSLTGVDTDRLPEERERGISIALGYALLTLPSGRRLSLVDVPGDE